LYTPRLVSNFAKIPGLVDALNKISPHLYPMAQESVGAAFGIAQKAPDQVKTQVLTAVSDSFVHGFQTACLVGVGMAFIGSLFALRFLPARAVSND
jgi:hypothetical protein